ncbi:phage tail tube protein [Prescottella equi]|uniref:phage tail tube protein n=1 Tax=Rhodococcus hoagii TaxID=43767 RepID=UPI000A3D9325|nr:hypothetical protein [Prescottella equi]
MSITSVKNARDELLISALDLAVILAPYGTDIPDSLSGPDMELLPFTPEWEGQGLIEKKAGVDITNESDSTPIESYGELDPTKMIKGKKTTTIDYTAQQSGRSQLEVYWSADYSDVVPDAQSGEVRLPAPSAPNIIYYSAILLGQDGGPGEEIYPYWICPKVSVTKTGKQSLTPEGIITYPGTLTAYKSRIHGYSIAQGFCGTGWKNLVDLGVTGFSSGNPVNEIQKITIEGSPTGGTFTLSHGGPATSAIANNPTVAQLKSALEGLPSIGSGNVTVTGATGGPFTVEFVGARAGQNVTQLTANSSGLTGGTAPTVTVTTETQGHA